jgi:hypothetical protein
LPLPPKPIITQLDTPQERTLFEYSMLLRMIINEYNKNTIENNQEQLEKLGIITDINKGD